MAPSDGLTGRSSGIRYQAAKLDSRTLDGPDRRQSGLHRPPAGLGAHHPDAWKRRHHIEPPTLNYLVS